MCFQLCELSLRLRVFKKVLNPQLCVQFRGLAFARSTSRFFLSASDSQFFKASRLSLCRFVQTFLSDLCFAALALRPRLCGIVVYFGFGICGLGFFNYIFEICGFKFFLASTSKLRLRRLHGIGRFGFAGSALQLRFRGGFDFFASNSRISLRVFGVTASASRLRLRAPLRPHELLLRARSFSRRLHFRNFRRKAHSAASALMSLPSASRLV